MNRPLFAVGEIVALQSKALPGLNGEYEILGVISPGESALVDGVAKVNVSGYGYDLGVVGLGGHSYWHESALRKRHQPGEYSFDALKQILAMPVSRGDFA